MLLGSVQDMIQRIEANRSKRKAPATQEKLRDLQHFDRHGNPTCEQAKDPAVVEAVIARIREQKRRERTRTRIIGWIMTILTIVATAYLINSCMDGLNSSSERSEFEIDENGQLRRSLAETPL